MFGRNNQVDTGWLGGVGFFDGFTEEQLRQVAELGERCEATAGALLVDQGRVGDECFVIVEGQAQVVANGEFVASVGAGSMVGEMALLEHRPRNASVLAETDMVLVSFDIAAFQRLLDDNPAAKERVQALLGARLNDNLSRRSGS